MPDSTSLAFTLAQGLAKVVGPGNVLLSLEDRDDHAFDAFLPERGKQTAADGPALPLAVVRPGSAEEVRGVLSLANKARLPVVPFGGGTGVMGAAVTLRPGLVLDLKRMDRVLELSEGGLMVRVQAGKVLGRLNEELEAKGLMLGHDPWSRGIATVGGAVSTNGVGYLAAKCGSMGEQVLGLGVALATGELLTARTVSKVAGPGLSALFVGAEGTLGVITEATLRVWPLPEQRTIRVYAFKDFLSGYHALLEMGRAGLRPSVIDFGEEPLVEPPNTFLRVAIEGPKDEVRIQERRAVEIFERLGGKDSGEDEARSFWETRHASSEAWAERNAAGRRLARGRGWGLGNRWFDYIHVALPPENIPGYKTRAEKLIKAAGMQCREYGIWGRPDLFSMAISGSEGREGDAGRGMALNRQIITLAHAAGGSMEYCHGVGLKLLPWVPSEFGEGYRTLQAIKGALDPNNILNPGKLGL